MKIIQAAFVVIFVALFHLMAGGESSAADSSFLQTAKAQASDRASGDQLGDSIALSGIIALVGAPGDAYLGSLSGSAYLFVPDSTGLWLPAAKLLASDGAAGDLFGGSVAIHGVSVLVGARGENSQGDLAGAVYVFGPDATGIWLQKQKLMASDGAAGRLFGFSVALSDNIAVIGARGTGENGVAGAAYVFVRDANGDWQEAQKLVPSASTPNDEFGCSVAVSSAAILVGACADIGGKDGVVSGSGAAYLFTQDNNGQWQPLQKLIASEGGAGDQFGYSVAINDTTSVVGSRFASGAVTNDVANHSGAAYVFVSDRKTSGTEKESQKLIPSEGETGDEFGARIGIVDNSIAIGAPGASVKGAASGAVYVFTLTPNSDGSESWKEMQQITARDGVSNDRFGQSLDFDGTTIVAGAPFDDITITNADDTITTFTEAGSFYVLSLTSVPLACVSKTDYDDAQCSGSFSIASLADIDRYVADDFGRKDDNGVADNNGKYKHVEISGSIANSPSIVVTSPCTITVQSGVLLEGDFVNLDGRLGVSGAGSYAISGKRVCLLSEQDSASPGDGTKVDADSVTIRAAKNAAINKGSTLNMTGDLIIESTGDFKDSHAILDADTVATVGSLRLTALHNASLGANVTVAVAGATVLQSTGTASNSQADIGKGAKLQSTDLTLSAPLAAKVGKSVTVRSSGQLNIESTGTDSKSSAAIGKGTQMIVGGDANITSGNKVVVDKKATLTVTGKLHGQAGSSQQCKINKSANVTAQEKSGNCFE